MTNLQSILLIAGVTLNTIISHASLKYGLKAVTTPTALSDLPGFLWTTLPNPFVWLSITLQVVGYIGWMLIISKERLAEAVALSGSFFYILTAVVGWSVFHEELGQLQILGLLLISAGVYLMSRHA